MQILSALAACMLMALTSQSTASMIYVSPSGSDDNPGTLVRPLKSLKAAQSAARIQTADHDQPVNVLLRQGTYYLDNTLIFNADDSGTGEAPVIYAAFPGEEAVISGGSKPKLNWKPFHDNIWKAQVPAEFTTDQLFVNGQKQILARYPNYDPRQRILNGYSKDSISKERAAKWADPSGGFIHAMHAYMWGDFHYLITGKNADGSLKYEGGWQNNRKLGMHDEYRFVENIFEELDSPGEWFLDSHTHTLYFYPTDNIDLKNADVECVRLKSLVEFQGSEAHPVKNLHMCGIIFRHAARTFMENREPLLRSDWTIYRGGAVILTGTDSCSLEDCFLDRLGGNAVFVNGYNRQAKFLRCRIFEAGANGIAFVGDPKAVRSPLFEYNERQSLNDIDRVPGPKTSDYPSNCLVENCLIHRTGRVEKQTAPIQIAMSKNITIRHCSLYEVPRAGINIGDGCWGGHVIEFCDIFDTVLETGDHGSFNSWGRDRYWGLKDVSLDAIALKGLASLPTLDNVQPTILRNNRWRCDHGWDIDLDDGSSNYQIIDNLCLNGGIKLREGFYRVCENNIMVNNSFHPHVWFKDSQDIFRHNIVFGPYQPIQVPIPWGQEFDSNLYHHPGMQQPGTAIELQNQSGRDKQSLNADAHFINAQRGDYRVKPNSVALSLGFKNFPMDKFGVQTAALKAIARTPMLPESAAEDSSTAKSGRRADQTIWLGAKLKDISGLGEVSAAGLPGEIGVLVTQIHSGTAADQVGFKLGDVIRKIDGKVIDSVADLLKVTRALSGSRIAVQVWRSQRFITLEVVRD